MSRPKIGSLFSGVGGLDLAVEEFFGADTAWQVEYDKHPSTILSRHWGVPNYGDVKTIDWGSIEPIQILCGGYPCQPFSQAGKRRGEDDERHLWPYFLEAIRQLRPSVVVLENVRNHLRIGFTSVLGSLADEGYDARWVVVRASEVGAPHRRERLFVLAWQKEVNPWPNADWGNGPIGGLVPETGDDCVMPTPTAWLGRRPGNAIGDPKRWTNPERSRELSDFVAHVTSGGLQQESDALLRTPTAQVTEAKNGIKLEGRTPSDPQVGLADQVVALFPTPKAQEAGWNVANTTTVDGAKTEPGHRAYDAKGVNKTWGMQQVVDSLLPTPRERDHKNAAATKQTALDRIDRGYGLDIAEAIQLLPTPRAMSGGPDNSAGKTRPSGHKGTTNLHGLIQDEFGVDLIGTPTTEPRRRTIAFQKNRTLNPQELVDAGITDINWGKYEAAVMRWESTSGRPAPSPVEEGTNRLNARFVEWMMGFPENWVDGLPRTAQLKALGNAVVPAQALHALGILTGVAPKADPPDTPTSLLPTPVVNDMGAGKSVEDWEALKEKWKGAHGNGNGHGNSLAIEVQLLPTPRAQNGETRNSKLWKRAADQPQNLENALAHVIDESLLPTPTARDYKDTGPNVNFARIAARGGLAGVAALLPTPTASGAVRGVDHNRANRVNSGGDDLVTAVYRVTKRTDNREIG